MLRASTLAKFSNNVICPLYMCVCIAGNEITSIESLQFDLATIKAATNQFSDDNKVGRGGFGEVYKVWN